jgi:hypothetical protein
VPPSTVAISVPVASSAVSSIHPRFGSTKEIETAAPQGAAVMRVAGIQTLGGIARQDRPPFAVRYSVSGCALRPRTAAQPCRASRKSSAVILATGSKVPGVVMLLQCAPSSVVP